MSYFDAKTHSTLNINGEKSFINIIKAFLDDKLYHDKSEQRFIFSHIPNGKYLAMDIDNVEETYKIYDKNNDYSGFDSHVSIVREIISTPTKYKYVGLIELNILIDGSISAKDKLVCEKLINDYKFETKDEFKKSTKYMSIDFVNKRIYRLDEVYDHQKLSLISVDEVDDILKDYFMEMDFIRHEACHTTSVLMDSVATHLADHHYYDQRINPEFNKYIDLAIENLYKAYNAVGTEENEVKKYLNNIHRNY